MRIKIDEDLPKAVSQLLRDQGYKATSIIEQGMSGCKDSFLWQVVQNEKRFFITADKGFADIRSHPPGTHAGIMLLRPDEDGIRPIILLLEMVLMKYDLRVFSGSVSVITPRGIRVRRSK